MKLYSLDEQILKEGHLMVSDIPDGFTGIIEYNTNDREWFLNGVYHRLDGPAIEYSDGNKEYWVDNRLYTKEQHNLLVDIMKLKGLL